MSLAYKRTKTEKKNEASTTENSKQKQGNWKYIENVWVAWDLSFQGQ